MPKRSNLIGKQRSIHITSDSDLITGFSEERRWSLLRRVYRIDYIQAEYMYLGYDQTPLLVCGTPIFKENICHALTKDQCETNIFLKNWQLRSSSRWRKTSYMRLAATWIFQQTYCPGQSGTIILLEKLCGGERTVQLSWTLNSFHTHLCSLSILYTWTRFQGESIAVS